MDLDFGAAMAALRDAGSGLLAQSRYQYFTGQIDVAEFERQVEVLISGRPIAWLQPGELILRR